MNRPRVTWYVFCRVSCATWWFMVGALFLFCALSAVISSAQSFTLIANFDGTHGANPTEDMTLVQGLDGNLYGVTNLGGAHGTGVVFKVAAGTITDLHDFTYTPPEGGYPIGGLVLATNGKFYGITPAGGVDGLGTAYSVTAKGVLKTLHGFTGSDGQGPWDHLIQASGKFYGTTIQGGSNGSGTAFTMTAAGVVKTLHSFTDGADGGFPVDALVQGTDGKFYGTTLQGGSNPADGTIFQMTTAGAVVILHNFTGGSDGGQPRGGLVQGLDGNFYGTTSIGGGGDGTIFKISPDGKTFTTLHTFSGYPGDGAVPEDTLALGTDGNLYGTTTIGGSAAAACNCGTVFQITPGGAYKMLYSFTGMADGRLAYGGLVQATDGNFYGTTLAGGSNINPACTYDATHTCGTIYSVSMGLSPFVETLPGHGKAGTPVKILGSSLMGATAVSFNGTPAAITCNTATEICTKVPLGATTGSVTVTTPSGVLTSNVPFRVP